jgi:hypothetical protein
VDSFFLEKWLIALEIVVKFIRLRGAFVVRHLSLVGTHMMVAVSFKD